MPKSYMGRLPLYLDLVAYKEMASCSGLWLFHSFSSLGEMESEAEEEKWGIL